MYIQSRLARRYSAGGTDVAAGALAAPGTKFGPCATECQHTDCAATREMAGTACRKCGESIGYDRRFFIEDDKQFIHYLCELEELEAQRAGA